MTIGKIRPWELPETPWETQSQYMTYVRGGLRRGLWNRHPVKLIKINTERVRIDKVLKSGKVVQVWGGQCYLCKEMFQQRFLEVDHLHSNPPLLDLDDAYAYLVNCIEVGLDDLAIACKPCHRIKTHADKCSVSFEKAKVMKRVITLTKSAKVAQKFAKDHNIVYTNIKTAKKDFLNYLYKEKT